MHIRLLAAVSMLAVALVLAGAGRGATPVSGTVGPGTLPATWQGQSYTAAAVADPALCPPASVDSSNTVCDNFSLTVGVDPSYWSIAAGGATVTINWADSANDFDLYVYDAAGNEVASSAQSSTTSEQAFIRNASGTYDVVVVPFTVTSSGYSGSASFVTQTPATISSGGPVAYNGVRVGGANPSTAPTTTAASRYKGSQLVLQSTDVGREAAEPTLGVDKTGTAFYAASTFDGPGGEVAHTLVLRSRDAGPDLAGDDTRVRRRRRAPGDARPVRLPRHRHEPPLRHRHAARGLDRPLVLGRPGQLVAHDADDRPGGDRPPDAHRGGAAGGEPARAAAACSRSRRSSTTA